MPRRGSRRDGYMADDYDQEACMSAIGAACLRRIHDCMVAGFTTYQSYPLYPKAQHDDRAAANCVYSHILTEVQGAFVIGSGAAVLDARGLKVLNIGDRVVGRFKKVDDEGRSRSYPTAQARKFDRQL